MGCGASRTTTPNGETKRPDKGKKSVPESPITNGDLLLDFDSASQKDDRSSSETAEKIDKPPQVRLSVRKARRTFVEVEWYAPESRGPDDWVGIFHEQVDFGDAGEVVAKEVLPVLGRKGLLTLEQLNLEENQSYQIVYFSASGSAQFQRQFWVEVVPEEDARFKLELLRKRPSSVTLRFEAPVEEEVEQDFVAIYERTAADANYLSFAYCLGSSAEVVVQRLNLAEDVTYHARFIVSRNGQLSAKAVVSFEVDAPFPESPYKLMAANVMPESVLVLYQVPPSDDRREDRIAVFSESSGSDKRMSTYEAAKALGSVPVTGPACGTVTVGGLDLMPNRAYFLVYLSAKAGGPVGTLRFAGPAVPSEDKPS